MKDSHIAIINIPRPVHVHPTLSTVSTLVRRGYRVTYTTSEEYSAELASLGAKVLRCPRLGPQPDSRDDPSTNEQCSCNIFDLASRTVLMVSSFYEKNVPNLILYDSHAFAGPILAERFAVPTVRMTAHIDERVDKPADGFLRDYGLPDSYLLYRSGEPIAYFFPAEFQLSDRVSIRNRLYAPRCAPERPHNKYWESTGARGRRTVLVSASTASTQGHRYYDMCAQALSDLGQYAVLAPTGNVTLPRSTSDFEIVQNIPQIVLMPHVDLIICAGGMATTMEAMYHGLPMIMLTHGVPLMEMYADNVQKHGLGIHVKGPNVTIDELKNCIAQTQNDFVLRGTVNGMQDRIKCSPGGEDLVNFVEENLNRTRT